MEKEKFFSKRAIIHSILFVLPVLLFVGIGMMDSKYSHCVVVESLGDFSGEYLLHSKATMDSFIPTLECEKMDRDIDDGDGKKNGKVRWFVCPRGPDCEEMAIF